METIKNVHFSESEKTLIIDISIKYKNIIENKRTDGITSKQKNIAWENITKEFNAHAVNVPRTIKQLRTFYDNLKKRLKRQSADAKVERYKTGGGSYIDKVDPVEEKLLDSLKATFETLPNPYDSSAKYHDTSSTTSGARTSVEPPLPHFCAANDIEIVDDHDYTTPEICIASIHESNASTEKIHPNPTPKRKRAVVADLYESFSDVTNIKKQKMLSKQKIVEKVEMEKLKILKAELCIREQQKEFERKKQELELQLLNNKLAAQTNKERFNEKKRQLELQLLQKQIDNCI